jgi:hypothetical protein
LEISHRTRDSHSVHIDHFSWKKKTEDEEQKQLKPIVHEIGSGSDDVQDAGSLIRRAEF